MNSEIHCHFFFPAVIFFSSEEMDIFSEEELKLEM